MRVVQLSTAAVKGFGLYHPEQIRVQHAGVCGDRDFFLVDPDGQLSQITTDGHLLEWWTRFDPDQDFLTIGIGDEVIREDRVERGDPFGAHFYAGRDQSGHLVAGTWSEFLSELADRPLRLVRADTPSGGNDVEPVSLISHTSCAAAGTEADGTPMDSRRFRMNVAFDGAEPYEEANWADLEMAIGTARFKIITEAARCVIVQRRTGDGGQKHNVLRMIAKTRGPQLNAYGGRGLNMGVYAQVLHDGVVGIGDELILCS